MKIKVYAIGGKWEATLTGDCPVGTAHDTFTLINLIDLVELKGGYCVSLHGTFGTDNALISGEYSLADARNLVKIAK
jgi:hypothetical protein